MILGPQKGLQGEFLILSIQPVIDKISILIPTIKNTAEREKALKVLKILNDAKRTLKYTFSNATVVAPYMYPMR